MVLQMRTSFSGVTEEKRSMQSRLESSKKSSEIKAQEIIKK